MKDITSLRFLLSKCKCNLEMLYQQQTLIELAVVSSTPDIVNQLIVSGASYDLPKLLCLLAQNSDQSQSFPNDNYIKALNLIQFKGELVTKGEKSALCEAVKNNNITLINLFVTYKSKQNKISLEEATSALELAREYAKDLFSPNINRYNLIVIKLTEFVKKIRNNLGVSQLLPSEKQAAPVNIAPYSSFHQPNPDNNQIHKPAGAANVAKNLPRP